MKLKRMLATAAAAALVCTSVMGVSAASLKDVFNPGRYADTYSDLKEAFGDDEEALYRHFLEYGIKEGREGVPGFDVKAYRERYADLDAAFGDDWAAYYDHYLTYGAEEGRNPFSGDFDPVEYAYRYPDLKEAYGDDALALYMHYLTFGIAEGRNAGAYDPAEDEQESDDQGPVDDNTSTEPQEPDDNTPKWEESGLEDHVMDWKDANLEAAMREITGIAEGDIMLSDVWELTSFRTVGKGIRDISALAAADAGAPAVLFFRGIGQALDLL